jgi:hypothetical protein
MYGASDGRRPYENDRTCDPSDKKVWPHARSPRLAGRLPARTARSTRSGSCGRYGYSYGYGCTTRVSYDRAVQQPLGDGCSVTWSGHTCWTGARRGGDATAATIEGPGRMPNTHIHTLQVGSAASRYTSCKLALFDSTPRAQERSSRSPEDTLPARFTASLSGHDSRKKDLCPSPGVR